MKKRLIVFTGGWGGEYLVEVLSGIADSAIQANVDVFAFVNFSIRTDKLEPNIAEVNFFKLPDISKFDGAILLANSFNCTEELDYLKSAISESHIPVLSIEYKLDGVPCITTDNFSGMYDLVSHVIIYHQASNLVFISGPKDHPECHERLNALRTVCRENSLSLPNDNILYADWSKVLIPDLIDDYLKTHDLPDAFICANDIMAIATCEHLKTMDISVPEDVIVTGFDCIAEAQNYDVPITSVNHEWSAMGRRAFEQIQKRMNHYPVINNSILSTTLVTGCSCGCTKDLSRRKIDKSKLGRALTSTKMDALSVDSHFRHFYRVVKGVDNAQELQYSFSYLFEHEHQIEGDDFSLFLDPECFNITEDNSNLTEIGHPKEYIQVGSLRDGKSIPLNTISYEDAIFDISDKKREANYYIYVPLYTEQYTLGFAILNGALNAANENQYYIWTRHMNQALEQIRSNITISTLYQKMRIISETDSLTGVYNRTGCESRLYPRLIDWAIQGGTSVVMLVDVDRMKVINDKFGHNSGDLALTTITSVLRDALPKNFSLVRFGGDEFLAIGCIDDPELDITELIAHSEQLLSDSLTQYGVNFPLTMSIGYSKIQPTTLLDIEKGLVAADKDMYERKKLHHSEQR